MVWDRCPALRHEPEAAWDLGVAGKVREWEGWISGAKKGYQAAVLEYWLLFVWWGKTGEGSCGEENGGERRGLVRGSGEQFVEVQVNVRQKNNLRLLISEKIIRSGREQTSKRHWDLPRFHRWFLRHQPFQQGIREKELLCCDSVRKWP